MINARLSFPTSETVVDLSKPLYELQSQLRKANVLTHPNNITLDNSRMLKVELFAEDSTGENILDLVDTDSDTLGTVNKLCSLIRKMDYRDDKVFTEKLERREIIERSLDNYGFILIADNMDDAVDAVNEIASEHLEVLTADPFRTLTKIRNAGAIFLGQYSSEPLGDYFAGPNHILPTNGTARFFSPLSVDDFLKKSSVIYYSREALESVHEDIERFAKAEGLTAHANSVAVRFE